MNSHLNSLIESIRQNDLTHADSYWNQYISSLTKGHYSSEYAKELGYLQNIREHEVRFTEGLLNEAELCQQIGIDFSKVSMQIESEWFLDKAESLGFVDATTYYARAQNYAKEWNDILHYNADFSDPMLKKYKNKWRENLTKFIKHSKDSTEIYKALLALTCIWSPARNTYFRDSVAPEIIDNLERFIDEYHGNPFTDNAYERLVYLLYTTERYAKLRAVCKDFLKRYQSSGIKEYIKFQLGNAHYFKHNLDEARKIYSSIVQDSFPNSVYPGWRKKYILKELKTKLKELEDSD